VNILTKISLFCLTGVLFALSSSYQSEQILHSQIMTPVAQIKQQIKHKNSAMTINYNPTLTFSLPWGTDAKSIPHTPFATMSLSGRFTTDPKRYIRPIYPIRIDKQQNLYVMFELPQNSPPQQRKYRIMRFDYQGKLASQFDIGLNANNVGEVWNIADFRPDHHNGIYLLEIVEINNQFTHRLRRVNEQGKDVWVKTGEFNYRELDFNRLAGKLEYLVTPDENSLYLPVRSPKHGLASFNTQTGQLIASYNWNEEPEQPIIDANQNVYYSYITEDDKYTIHKHNLNTKKTELIKTDIELLHDFAQIDQDGNFYLKTYQGLMRLSPKGKLAWQKSIYGLVVRKEDNHIFICDQAEEINNTIHLEIEHYDNLGNKIQEFSFQLPKSALPDNYLPRLVHIDPKNQLYFYGGESDDQAGILFIFTSDGKLQSSKSLNLKNQQGYVSFDQVNKELLPIETTTAPTSMFEVDQLGNIYIPVSDPQGFKVIRLQPNVQK
jgi:hypothetical protein